MTNDRFRIHLTSGNSAHRNQQESGAPKDRRQLLKYAIFYLVVAAILVVANKPAKSPTAAAAELRSAVNLQIDLSVTRKVEPNRLASNVAAVGAHVVRFRLTNEGNVPIFYPVSSNTRRPMGRIVCRNAPGADWKAILTPELSRLAPTQLNLNAEVAWIEMPPGGWADGDYVDPGFPGGEHAYEMGLKYAADGKVTTFLSNPYPAETN
jgi:hypothetical protein